MATHPVPTHTEVAAALKLSVSGVSRLRAGKRAPSKELIQRIADTYAWPLCDQLETLMDRGPSGYAESLNQIMHAARS